MWRQLLDLGVGQTAEESKTLRYKIDRSNKVFKRILLLMGFLVHCSCHIRSSVAQSSCMDPKTTQAGTVSEQASLPIYYSIKLAAGPTPPHLLGRWKLSFFHEEALHEVLLELQESGDAVLWRWKTIGGQRTLQDRIAAEYLVHLNYLVLVTTQGNGNKFTFEYLNDSLTLTHREDPSRAKLIFSRGR